MESKKTNNLTSNAKFGVKPAVTASDAKEKRKERTNAEETEQSPKRRRFSPIVYDKSSTPEPSEQLNKSLMDNNVTTTHKSKAKCSHGSDCEFGKNCSYVQALAICSVLPSRKLTALKTGATANNKIKQKCIYWPRCKAGYRCVYIHPPVMCSKFPMCKFGNMCNYKHPNCKYGISCTKEECIFSHPCERQCKYYPMCTKPKCPYLHPISATLDMSKFSWYKKD